MADHHEHHDAPHDDDADRRTDDARRPTWLEGVDEAGQGVRGTGPANDEHGRDPWSETGGSEQPDADDAVEPPHLEHAAAHDDVPAPTDDPAPPAPDDAPPPEQPGLER